MNNNKTLLNLESLLHGVDYSVFYQPEGRTVGNQSITDITSDSRDVVTGGLFVALQGESIDGHFFIKSAVENGCSTIVAQKGVLSLEQVQGLGSIVIEVENSFEAYGNIAVNYFGRPATKLKCVGITGTNGKTTVTYLVEEILLCAGKSVGVIGTVNNRYRLSSGVKKSFPTRFTTPEPKLLQSLLAEMVTAGVEYVVMEVSSHALAQSRVFGVSFEVAAITNISRDHLDYHKEMATYFQAKSKLFTRYLIKNGVVILPETQIEKDSGSEWLVKLHRLCREKNITTTDWGTGADADIKLLSCVPELESTTVVLESEGTDYSVTTPLVGRFNVDNMLTAFSIGRALQISPVVICQALSRTHGAPGRLARIEAGDSWQGGGPVVLVDYAHTPDALEKVLSTLKTLPHRELIAVFGCGGDRDNGKRSVMGAIVARFAEVAVVTDDNPRTEEPSQIVGQILSGVQQGEMLEKDSDWLFSRKKNERGCVVIRDRATAIEQAIRSATEGDIVLVAGKGHEPYQLSLAGKRYFDDSEEAKDVLYAWTDELVAKAVSGRLVDGEGGVRLLGSVLTDSRSQGRDSVFVALKGDNHDGHAFVEQAVANGARCLVVDHEIKHTGLSKVSQVVVRDTTEALGDLASYRRKSLAQDSDPLIIGITGSCGKTTVKEMVAVILARKWPEGEDYPRHVVLKTKGNFNNLIGLPLSLLPLGVQHRAAVLEMGMNQSGELERLGRIAQPGISCITNVHGAHLEGLGSIEGVARAKEELFQATPDSGTLIVNLDDPLVRTLSARYNQTKLSFAVSKEASDAAPDVWASDLCFETGGEISFFLHFKDQVEPIYLHIAGEHNVSNALCAAAICLAGGADLQQVAAGLADFRPPEKRMEILKGREGIIVINDTYNANPASMAAGLQTLVQIGAKKTVAVIGDMLELGASSAKAHYDIGKLIVQLGVDYLCVVGEFRQDVIEGAVDAGGKEKQLNSFATKDEAVDWLEQLIKKKQLSSGDSVLVKASRGRRFETITAQLVAQ